VVSEWCQYHPCIRFDRELPRVGGDYDSAAVSPGVLVVSGHQRGAGSPEAVLAALAQELLRDP
jgi:hypothetical protein